MQTCFEFQSASFPKYPNEDEELVNTNRWGKRLAEFIRDQLPRHGMPTGDIVCEDWGWLVQMRNADFPLWIGCGPMDEIVDMDEARNDPHFVQTPHGPIIEFCVFVMAKPTFIQRLFRRIDTRPAIQQAVDALKSMIDASPEFTNVRWTD